MLAESHRRIYEVVRRVPRGRVATYGQVARLAGLPRHARLVGYALHRVEPEDRVPWHRVLNAQGRVSARAVPGAERLQEELLREEGVELDLGGRVDLRRYRWRPPEDP